MRGFLQLLPAALQDRSLPVFAYSDGDEDLKNWIWRDERIIKLPADAVAAALRVIAELSG
ncbi:MAG TPA: hypothetical protein VFA19_03430 [Gaiellaceae bacterium]|nr:hypothetical protein [Gaiellaceae bacterium]